MAKELIALARHDLDATRLRCERAIRYGELILGLRLPPSPSSHHDGKHPFRGAVGKSFGNTIRYGKFRTHPHYWKRIVETTLVELARARALVRKVMYLSHPSKSVNETHDLEGQTHDSFFTQEKVANGSPTPVVKMDPSSCHVIRAVLHTPKLRRYFDEIARMYSIASTCAIIAQASDMKLEVDLPPSDPAVGYPPLSTDDQRQRSVGHEEVEEPQGTTKDALPALRSAADSLQNLIVSPFDNSLAPPSRSLLPLSPSPPSGVPELTRISALLDSSHDSNAIITEWLLPQKLGQPRGNISLRMIQESTTSSHHGGRVYETSFLNLWLNRMSVIDIPHEYKENVFDSVTWS